MKLTTELIFDGLSKQYDIKYTQSSNKNTIVGRPLFFDGASAVSGHICILPSNSIDPDSLSSGAYIAIGELSSEIPVPNVELMTLPENVSPAGLLNEIQKIFNYYDEWENEINKIMEEKAGYPAIIHCSAKFLDCAMSLVDANFSVIAIASREADTFRDSDNKISESIMNDLITDPLFSQGLRKEGIFEFSSGVDTFLSCNIKKDCHYLGRVTLICDNKRSKGSYTYLLLFLVSKINVMLRMLGSFLINDSSLTSLHEVLAGCLNSLPMDPYYVSFKLRENGWSDQHEYVLIRLQPEFRHEWQMHTPLTLSPI